MDLRLLTDLLTRRWRVLVLAALIAAGAGWYVGTVRPATYESTARALVGPIAGDVDAVRVAGSNVETYAQLVSTQLVVTATIDQVGPPSTPDEFLQRVRVRTDQTSRIISITVTDTDRQRAADTANVLFEYLAELLPAEAEAVGRLLVVDSARPADRPTSPSPAILGALAGVAGLVAALLSIIVLEYLDGRVRSRHDLESVVSAPFLGAVQVQRPLRAAGDGHVPVHVHVSARELASRLLAGGPDRLRSLLVPSLEPGDEAAELAATLAAAAALAGRRVALLDCDDVSRRLTTQYGKLIGSTAATSSSAQANMSLTLVEPAVLPRDGNITNVAQQLREMELAGWDLTVVQVGPLDRSRAAGVWARAVDAVVVAARSDSTRRDLLKSVADTLDVLGVVVAGTALMIVSRGRRGSSAGSQRTRALPQSGSSQGTRADAEPSGLGSAMARERDS